MGATNLETLYPESRPTVMAASTKSESVKLASASQRPEHAPASAHAAVEVIALTTRDDFLLELGQCLDGTASIAPVESSALALAAAAKSKRVQVIVIDSRDLADLRAEVDLLQARAPALTALVFAEQDAEVEVAAALKGSNVFAVLPLPIDARKTSAVFEGAVVDARSEAKRRARRPAARASWLECPSPGLPLFLRMKPSQPRHVATGSVPAEALRDAARVAGRSTPSCWPGLPASSPPLRRRGSCCASSRRHRPCPSPVSAGERTGPECRCAARRVVAGDVGNVDELLEKARVAMRERRYTEPANNSALLYYRSAAQVDPGNGEALDGLNRLRPGDRRALRRTDQGRPTSTTPPTRSPSSRAHWPADASIAELRLAPRLGTNRQGDRGGGRGTRHGAGALRPGIERSSRGAAREMALRDLAPGRQGQAGTAGRAAGPRRGCRRAEDP